jgi:hypothetical protein
MPIHNFPTALQPLIAEGYLDREFHQALQSRLGYRACADREAVSGKVGETLTKTRPGLKHTGTTGALEHGIEQYRLPIAHHGTIAERTMMGGQVGIASGFLQHAYVNGEEAGRKLSEIASAALFNACLAGNTRVRITLDSANEKLAVDDIRGFTTHTTPGGDTSVSHTNPLTVIVGNGAYTLIEAIPDRINVSTSPNGISGILTFNAAIAASDRIQGRTVRGSTASVIIRPSGRENTSALGVRDTLTVRNLQDGVNRLRDSHVPEIDGVYNCYLDPMSARQLFADPEFKTIFSDATSPHEVFRKGLLHSALGLRFIATIDTFAQPHPTQNELTIRRPVICGRGALIEGDFAGMPSDDWAPPDSIVTMIDDVAMVTRKQTDGYRQIIGQSWYWIGGFSAPKETTVEPLKEPTPANAAFKRAILIEHVC